MLLTLAWKFRQLTRVSAPTGIVGRFGSKELDDLHRDLDELVGALSVAQQLSVIQRISRTYSFLRPHNAFLSMVP